MKKENSIISLIRGYIRIRKQKKLRKDAIKILSMYPELFVDISYIGEDVCKITTKPNGECIVSPYTISYVLPEDVDAELFKSVPTLIENQK